MPIGSITVLNYGYRLISAIGGSVLFRSVIVAIVPRLTAATANADQDEVKRLTRLGVRIMLLVSLPLTAFMAVLARPAALAVFRRGNFSRTSAALLGVVLAAYSLSLVGSAIQRALLAPFFAALNTRIPLRNTVYGVAANIALIPLCLLPFGRSSNGVIGIAIAYSLAQYVNVGHAWYRMRKDLAIRLEGTARTLWRVGAASSLAGAAMVGAYLALGVGRLMPRWLLLAKSCLIGFLGLAVVAALLPLIAADELRQLTGSVFRPRSRRPEPRP
jgi:peptidoglycan biosynthesis protein MviN/MurJ (putative lipid II flippase)